MSQNSITAAALVIAFIIFITVRGELPSYFGALGIGSASEKPAATATATSTQQTGASAQTALINLGKLTRSTGPDLGPFFSLLPIPGVGFGGSL